MHPPPPSDRILAESLTVEQAAAPTGTIAAVLVAFGIAIVLIVPSFIVLYVLDQRSLLPGEGVEDRTGMEGGMT